MKNKKLFTAVTTCALAVSMIASGASAANVTNATIDTDKTASLTLYKYDMTAAALDGVTESPTATGYADSNVESMYAPYAVQGVEFTYLKVADIQTYTQLQSDGTNKIEVVYGIDSSASADLLSALDLTQTEVVYSTGSTYYYESDTLINALEAAETADLVSTKNALETFVETRGGTAMTETDATGMTSADGLDLGLYLVLETRVPEQITSTVKPFFVSLPMTQNDGDEWNYNVRCYPKNESGMPTLDKLVTEVTTAKAIDYEPTATASDGDILYYQITSTLPSITSKSTYLSTYTFIDTLSKGVEYYTGTTDSADQLMKAVKIEFFTDSACTNLVATWTQQSDPTKFTVTYGTADNDATTMTIAMTEAGLAAINPAYGDYTMRVSYSATVNSSADVVYGENGNPNDVTLTWKRTNTNYYDTLKDQCYVYTFAIDMTKQFSDNAGDYSAVSFKVQNTTDGYYLIASKDSDGVYYVTGEACKTADEAAATTFVPNSKDGSLLIYGVEDDTYVITELTTDDGYTLLKDNITVVISTQTQATVFDQNASHCADGAADGVAYDNYMSTSANAIRTASATVDSNSVTMKEVASSKNASVPMTVVNTHGFKLPQTGGEGSMAMIVGGMAVATLAGFAVVAMLRKKNIA